MEPLLKIENVTVRFGGLDAVKNVSLQLREGEIRGLIGPNGAGKSTLFNAVSGIVPASRGPHRIPRRPTSRPCRLPRAPRAASAARSSRCS